MFAIRVCLLTLVAVSGIIAAVQHQIASDLADGTSEHRIIGGSAVPYQSLTYVASLQLYSSGHRCGAAIINRRYVLTAAHCTIGQPAQNLRVRVGSKQKSSGGVLHYVSVVRHHPQFDSYNRLNDIALVKTTSTIVFNSYVSYVALSTYNYDNSYAVVAGWGRVNKYQGSYNSESLQQLSVRTISNSDCKKRYAYKPVIANNIQSGIICTLPNNGQGVCDGDNGSPLIINGQLAGLVAWHTGDCANGIPDAYTRVSTYNQWIVQNSRDY